MLGPVVQKLSEQILDNGLDQILTKQNNKMLWNYEIGQINIYII